MTVAGRPREPTGRIRHREPQRDFDCPVLINDCTHATAQRRRRHHESASAARQGHRPRRGRRTGGARHPAADRTGTVAVPRRSVGGGRGPGRGVRDQTGRPRQVPAARGAVLVPTGRLPDLDDVPVVDHQLRRRHPHRQRDDDREDHRVGGLPERQRSPFHADCRHNEFDHHRAVRVLPGRQGQRRRLPRHARRPRTTTRRGDRQRRCGHRGPRLHPADQGPGQRCDIGRKRARWTRSANR